MGFESGKIYLNFFLFLIPFLIAICSTSFFIPNTIKLSEKYKILDFPNKRKQHKEPISRIGGISLIFGFYSTNYLIWIFTKFTQFKLFEFSILSKISFLGLILFFIVGFADDLYSISPIFRLFTQIIISSSLWIVGIQINNIDFSMINPDIGLIELPNSISFILTTLWITGITNAFNWIDGLDGLAAGTSLIANLSLAIICQSIGNYEISLILLILAGTNIGFLFYNKFPAKLLMGDGGSYFLGSSYSIYSLILLSSINSEVTNFNIIIPLLLIFLPLTDMVFVIFSRIKKGLSPFIADRSHIHHRLLDMGFNHKNTVNILILSQLTISIFLLSILK